VLDFRNKPGVIVVVTDGEETCGRSPCDLAKQLHDAALVRPICRRCGAGVSQREPLLSVRAQSDSARYQRCLREA
jgi:hypothetical protein